MKNTENLKNSNDNVNINFKTDDDPTMAIIGLIVFLFMFLAPVFMAYNTDNTENTEKIENTENTENTNWSYSEKIEYVENVLNNADENTDTETYEIMLEYYKRKEYETSSFITAKDAKIYSMLINCYKLDINKKEGKEIYKVN
jgi:lipopolysaccharide export LptBFGC system permease protein LptF